MDEVYRFDNLPGRLSTIELANITLHFCSLLNHIKLEKDNHSPWNFHTALNRYNYQIREIHTFHAIESYLGSETCPNT